MCKCGHGKVEHHFVAWKEDACLVCHCDDYEPEKE
jgi:hypothetical protein